MNDYAFKAAGLVVNGEVVPYYVAGMSHVSKHPNGRFYVVRNPGAVDSTLWDYSMRADCIDQ